METGNKEKQPSLIVNSVLPRPAVFAGRSALPLFGDAMSFLKSCPAFLPIFLSVTHGF